MDNIDNKYNPQLCKIFLAISDLIFFNLALWFSLGCVYFIFDPSTAIYSSRPIRYKSYYAFYFVSSMCRLVLDSFATLYIPQAILV
ncbi:UDP-phosphate galactose phosphotransferase [Salmonella enterica subsp. enterica]|uniref:UDP-phosphate galactose phosphotransferase n=1 Tax=Salmonella enterica I TaxID=59201 RepID=A0A3S4HYX8_SALET|nr:UDP-phosphate galactose phosphotransferase [Salmonella enterica subsp. enterica]